MSATPPAHADAARVVLYTRTDCHLCEVAEQVVAEVCGSTGDSWTTIDIDDDADLRGRFTDQVPVVFVDGAQHDFWRVDPDRLQKALARR